MEFNAAVNVSSSNQHFVSRVLDSFAERFRELGNNSDETARKAGHDLASILHKTMTPGASVARTTDALTSSESNSLVIDKKFPAEFMSQRRLIEMSEKFKFVLEALPKDHRGEIAQSFVAKLIKTDSLGSNDPTSINYYATIADSDDLDDSGDPDDLDDKAPGSGTAYQMIAHYFKERPVELYVRSDRGLVAGEVIKAIVEYAVNDPDANIAQALINFVNLQDGRYRLNE